MSIACTKPKDLGLASEFWTYEALAKYIKDNCNKTKHPSLKKLSKGTVLKILSKSDIKPHKISYYLEKKDADFDWKMAQIVHVYKEEELYKVNENYQQMIAYPNIYVHNNKKYMLYNGNTFGKSGFGYAVIKR